MAPEVRLVPEVRVELTRGYPPTDFESAASTIPPLRHDSPRQCPSPNTRCGRPGKGGVDGRYKSVCGGCGGSGALALLAHSRRGRAAWGSMERKTGFEPATFSLARRRSTTEPLPLAPAGPAVGTGAEGTDRHWCRGTELNCRHRHFQCRALPPELPRPHFILKKALRRVKAISPLPTTTRPLHSRRYRATSAPGGPASPSIQRNTPASSRAMASRLNCRHTSR